MASSSSWSPGANLDGPIRARSLSTGAASDDDDVLRSLAQPERVVSRLRTQETLRAICKKYSIPNGFTPVLAGDLPSSAPPPAGSVCVYVDALDAGMRLPLHPFFGTVLRHFGIAPGQLAPNGWRALAGFVVLSHFARVAPSLAVFRYFFALCPCRNKLHSLRGKEVAGLLFGRLNAKNRGWKEEFFFLASSAPWPCPVQWGEPSKSSTLDPTLTIPEKTVAANLLRARGSSPIDLATYLHDSNLAAAKIIRASPPSPTPQEKEAAAARASAAKVAVKSERDPNALPFGKRRKLGEGPSCPPGFSAPRKPLPTSKDGGKQPWALRPHGGGDWQAARQLLQGVVTPSRERELAASKPADVVASSYLSLLQTANEVAFSLGYALELEEKLRARAREADEQQAELGRKLKAQERRAAEEADALRAELREAKAEAEAAVEALRAELRAAKAELEEAKGDADWAKKAAADAAAREVSASREHARALAERELHGYARGMEDMKRAALRRYPRLDPARLVVPIHGPP